MGVYLVVLEVFSPKENFWVRGDETAVHPNIALLEVNEELEVAVFLVQHVEYLVVLFYLLEYIFAAEGV